SAMSGSMGRQLQRSAGVGCKMPTSCPLQLKKVSVRKIVSVVEQVGRPLLRLIESSDAVLRQAGGTRACWRRRIYYSLALWTGHLDKFIVGFRVPTILLISVFSA